MYSKEKTMFVLNAPTAGKSSVTIRLYKDGHKGKAYKTLKMRKMGDERWEATVKGDLKDEVLELKEKIESLINISKQTKS